MLIKKDGKTYVLGREVTDSSKRQQKIQQHLAILNEIKKLDDSKAGMVATYFHAKAEKSFKEYCEDIISRLEEELNELKNI